MLTTKDLKAIAKVVEDKIDDASKGKFAKVVEDKIGNFFSEVLIPYFEKSEKRINSRFDMIERKLDKANDKDMEQDQKLNNHEKRIGKLEQKSAFA